MTMWKFSLFGIVIQAVLLVSIFEIYLEKNDKKCRVEDYIKNLVVYVVDCLPLKEYRSAISKNKTLYSDFYEWSASHFITNDQALGVITNESDVSYFGLRFANKTVNSTNKWKISLIHDFWANNGTGGAKPVEVDNHVVNKVIESAGKFNTSKVVVIRLSGWDLGLKYHNGKSDDIKFSSQVVLQSVRKLKAILDEKYDNLVHLITSDMGLLVAGTNSNCYQQNSLFAIWGKHLKLNLPMNLTMSQAEEVMNVVLKRKKPDNNSSLLEVSKYSKCENKRYRDNRVFYQNDESVLRSMLREISSEGKKNHKTSMSHSNHIRRTVLQFFSLENPTASGRTLAVFLALLTYAGWILLLISLLLKNDVNSTNLLGRTERTIKFCYGGSDAVFLISCAIAVLLFVENGWPAYYIFFCMSPPIVWRLVREQVSHWFVFLKTIDLQQTISVGLNTVSIFSLVEFVYWSTQYIYLFYLGFALFIVYSVARGYMGSVMTWYLLAYQLLCCIAVGSSYFLPGFFLPRSYILLNVSGTIWFTTACICFVYMHKADLDRTAMTLCTVYFVCCLMFSNMLFVYSSSVICLLVVVCIIMAYFLPFFGTGQTMDRLLHLSICSASAMSLLSTSGELFALWAVAAQCLGWSFIEFNLRNKNENMKKSGANLLGAMFLVLALYTSLRAIGITFDSIHYINPLFIIRLLHGNSAPAFALSLFTIKISIVVLLLVTFFIATNYEKQEVPNYLMVILILNFISLRLFVDVTTIMSNVDLKKKIAMYLFTQVICIIILTIFSFVQSLSSLSFFSSKEKRKIQETTKTASNETQL